jgi:hypothetical protein
MWKPTFFVLALAVALLPYSSSLSLPLFFGLDSKLRSLTTALEKSSVTELLNLLRYYDLQQICHHESQPRTNLTGVTVASPRDIWGNSGDLLALSLPSIFRNVTIDGDWNDATRRTHILADCPAAGRYARSAPLAHTQQFVTNTAAEV